MFDAPLTLVFVLGLITVGLMKNEREDDGRLGRRTGHAPGPSVTPSVDKAGETTLPPVRVDVHVGLRCALILLPCGNRGRRIGECANQKQGGRLDGTVYWDPESCPHVGCFEDGSGRATR